MTTIKGAPFDWYAVTEYLPPTGEVVRVHQLVNFAVMTESGWMAVDSCGNRRPLLWQPEYWRRDYYPALPAEKGKTP